MGWGQREEDEKDGGGGGDRRREREEGRQRKKSLCCPESHSHAQNPSFKQSTQTAGREGME